MKIDLILENIRNQYTLGLLEESTGAGLDEKTVLKGKMLINESTMELRKMLIQEGVMADVRAMLHDRFARVIEESIFGWEPAVPDYDADAEAASRATQSFANGVKNAFTAPESQRDQITRLGIERALRREGFDKGYGEGADEYTNYLTQVTQDAGKLYNDAQASHAANIESMKSQHANEMAEMRAQNAALQAKYDSSVSGQVNSAIDQAANKVNGVVDQASNAAKPHVDSAKDAYNTNVAPTVEKAGAAINNATNTVKESYNNNVAPTVNKISDAAQQGYQSAVGTINNGVTKAREAYDAATPYQVAGAAALGAGALGAAGYGAYRMGQRRR